MNRFSRSSFALSFLVFPFLFWSCGKSSNPIDPPLASVDTPLEADAEGFVHRTQVSMGTGVTLRSSVLSDAARQAQEEALAHAKLRPVSLSPSYNVSLWSASEVRGLEDSVFMLPKPMTEGFTWTDGMVHLTPQPGGAVRLSFPVFLVNPKDTVIFVRDSRFMGTPIPGELQLHDAQSFDEELKQRGLKLASSATLSGCPVSLCLEVHGKEYDVTPQDWKQSTPCPVLKEYEARLRLNTSDADAFQKQLASGSNPQLRLNWRIGVSYPIARYSLSFEAETLWNKIESAGWLNGRHKLGSASVPPLVRDVLLDAIKKSALTLPKLWEEHLNPLIAQIIQTFFELSDPTSLRDCAPIGPAEKCALLNESWKSDFPGRSVFVLEWQESETDLTSEHVSSWAPFKKSLN